MALRIGSWTFFVLVIGLSLKKFVKVDLLVIRDEADKANPNQVL